MDFFKNHGTVIDLIYVEYFVIGSLYEYQADTKTLIWFLTIIK